MNKEFLLALGKDYSGLDKERPPSNYVLECPSCLLWFPRLVQGEPLTNCPCGLQLEDKGSTGEMTPTNEWDLIKDVKELRELKSIYLEKLAEVQNTYGKDYESEYEMLLSGLDDCL